MTWVRIDDSAPDHPKLVGLDDDAFAMWMRGLCYCARHGTDGGIPIAALRRLTSAKSPAKVADKLVAAGLWDAADSASWTYQVHDFLEYNPSAESVRRERERKQAAGRTGGIRSSAGRSRDQAGAWVSDQAQAKQVLGDVLAEVPKQTPSSRASDPVPSRPVPSDPSGGSEAPAAPAPRREPKPRPEAGPKPESPEQRAWRTWRAAYSAYYRRAYPSQTTDGPAMKRAAKLAEDMCAELGKGAPEELERLLAHRWRAYLADPGQSRAPGGPGFLAETKHPLMHFERGIAAYGTPWDREHKQAPAPPKLLPPPAETEPEPGWRLPPGTSRALFGGGSL